MRATTRMMRIAIVLLVLTAPMYLSILPMKAQEVTTFNINGGNYNPPPVGHRNYFAPGILPHVGWCLEPLTHYYQANASYLAGIASDWTLSEDYLTFTMQIRQGVKWHDGTEMTTKDIVATFYCLYLRLDRPWYFIDNIEVVDDYNLIFHQSEPTDRVQFYVLWHYTPVPYSQYGTFSDRVQAKIAEGYNIFSNPEEFQDIWTDLQDYRPETAIGTGPYKEKEVTDVEIVLEAFDDYWNGVPPIDEIHLPRITSSDVMWTMLLNGELDYYWGTPTPEQLAELETKPFAELIKISRPLGPSIYFNHRVYPLNVKEVRQAIAYAVNRTELAYIQYPIGGIPEEYVVGGSSYYLRSVCNDSFIDEYIKPNFAYEYDLVKAEQLLIDLGYTKGTDGVYVTPNGTRLEFEFLSGGDWLSAEATEALCAMLEQIGIKATPRIIDATVMGSSDGPFYLGNYQICAYFGLASPSFIFEEMFIKYNLIYPGCGFPVMQSAPWLTEPVNVSYLTQRISLFPAQVTQAELNEIYATLTYICGDQLPTIGLFTRPVIIMLNKQKFAGWPSPEDTTYWNSLSSYEAHGRSYLFRWFKLKPLLQLTVSVDPSGGGTTSPATGTYTYMKGETATFTAAVASGYNFEGWQLDGTQVSTSASYTVTMDTSHTLTAVFSRIPYELYAAVIIVVIVVIAAVVYFIRK